MAWYCDWGVFGYQRWPWLKCRLALLWLVKWIIWISGHGHFQVIYSDYIYIHILCHCITTLSPLQQSVLVIKSYFCWLMFTFCWLNTLFNHHFFLVVIPWKTSSGESREQLTIMWKNDELPPLCCSQIPMLGSFCWLNPWFWLVQTSFLLVKSQCLTLYVGETSKVDCDVARLRSWSEGQRLTPCLAFRDDGNYKAPKLRNRNTWKKCGI